MKSLLKFNKYYFQKQYDTIDCGPSCLRMMAGHHGRDYSLEYLREACFLSKEGVSLLNLSNAAEEIGFRTFMAHLKLEILLHEAPLPCILHWNQNHFVVLYRIRKSWNGKPRYVIGDPAHGIVTIDDDTFKKAWISSVSDTGTALFMEPTPEFYNKERMAEDRKGYNFLFQYVLPYKRLLLQLIIGMLAGSLITLAFPFLTQVLIDRGVGDKNISVVLLVLVSQLFLFLGNTVISIIRSWLLLHINARISLHIISDFLMKLLRLPIRFFDTKAVGDLSQRINDHHRIENFLTGQSISTVFSIINIIVFIAALSFYNWKIVATFCMLSSLAILWIFLFQHKRAQLDYMRFARNKENQDKLYEMITGMQEIKLYGSEVSKRWEWEQLQVKYFKLNIKSLALEQYQQSGYIFITHLKNILVSFFTAYEAIQGNLSLGGLLSVSYIIGQTNGPLDQLIVFVKAAQDAKLSMDRLQEVQHKKNEEEGKKEYPFDNLHHEIYVNNLSFQYEGPHSAYVLKNVNITIPKGKITAIVGSSGSGKTTLMKLLLAFYKPGKGSITIGKTNLQDMSPKQWRKQCGTVLQDGYIFFDTIAGNIALDGEEIDPQRMNNAVHVANLKEFIDNLPLGYTTKIGNSGIGISGGQKQRILIARAVYKNPDYLFFDEATSSLDANNEKVIMDNFNEFFKGKTVVIIAHRLSTVRNADQIIVLEKGEVVETGTHDMLTRTKGKYYKLVKNQLELGS